MEQLRAPLSADLPLRDDCPVCGARDLVASVVLDGVPTLCNALSADQASARDAARGTFAVTFCRECGHLFNAAFDESRIDYTQDYENSLHFSPRFVAFVDKLTERLSRTYPLAGRTVVDIGCGKGDFLRRLCGRSGATGIGFDKSFEADRARDTPGVTFVNDWFGADYPDVRPDFVACRQVLEHIADPSGFVRALGAHPGVSPETVFYFEVPNALYTLRDLGIWDLIYEHANYFTPPSLRRCFEAAGFEVLDTGPSFGGQYLFVEARRRPGAGPCGRSGDVADIEGLVRGFERAFQEKVARWQELLTEFDPAETVVWGSGSKGITFVNVVPSGDRIRAMVDVNLHKQGRFVPGTGTPVLAPEALRGAALRTIVVMNPLYRDEIAHAAAALGLTAEVVVA
jgi:SAM-dependent methyltransferase